jgi:membrane dipeptidase
MDMLGAEQIHREAIIVDATAPLLQRPTHLGLYAKGGVTCVAPTVTTSEDSGQTLKALGRWLRLLSTRPDLLHIRSVADVRRAKAEGKLGILFHFQGTEPFEADLDLVEAYQTLGLRMVMLTYNVKNLVGDGCEERTDAGLSRFGVRLIERLNANRVVVDVAHTGYRTTMEAMEASTRPVVFSHSNAKALLDTRRNITDEQARTAARTGGLVGVVACPYFVVQGRRPTLDEFIDHIAHFAEVAGIDHVGLGLDFWWGVQPFSSDAEAESLWQRAVDAGRWDSTTYPKPPHYYPVGLETPAQMGALTEGLLRRGFCAEDTRKVMGENWLRVFRDVWGE